MSSARSSYRLDLARYELRRGNGVKVKLERQPMELLILLVEKNGRLVTREEVAARLWPVGVTVDTEPAINNAVRKIRTALRDSPERPSYVETVVGKGYRYIGDLEVIGAEQAIPKTAAPVITLPPAEPPGEPAPLTRKRHVGWWMALTMVALAVLAAAAIWVWARPEQFRRGPVRSLAVLPLDNLSGDPAQQYLADGITDELTTNLARIGDLRLISRTSTVAYKRGRKTAPQIARELNVDAVLEGSVVRVGNRVRVTAQLIDARRDAHLWAQSYERNIGDMLELEDAVALDIASEVKANLETEVRQALSSRHSVAPAAYEAYLRGRSEIGKQTQASFRSALEYFQKAADADPLYAGAYTGMAQALNMMGRYGVLPEKEAFPRAEAAARKALRLDPRSGEAHGLLGYSRLHFDWDWPGAEAELRRALELGPGLALTHSDYADYLDVSGRSEEALRELRKAHELDPASLNVEVSIGHALITAHHPQEAVQQLQKVLALDPNRRYAWMHLGLAHEQEHKFAEAIRDYQRASELLGFPADGLAHTYALMGEAATARRFLHQAEEPDTPHPGGLDWFYIACIYAALGDKDRAFAWLDKAYDNRDSDLVYVKVHPWTEPLRSDPRMKALYKRMGIPE